MGAPYVGGWTKRFPTHTPRLCRWLVALCGLCPLALPPGPRTPASGQQVAELVHVESLPKRTALQPPRDRPPVGTSATEENPAQPRKAQEGRLRGGKEGRLSSGIEVPRKLDSSFARNAPNNVRSQSPDCRLRSCCGKALRWLRPRWGDWGTDHDPVVPALQRVGNNTHCTSAGAAAQISVGPAAHHRLPRQGQLPNQRCSAVGAQSRSNRSGQFPSSH